MTGEFARIDLFLKAFRAHGGLTEGAAVELGPGDDAAIVHVAKPLAVTTDAIVENVHFRLDWATPEQIGHKALAVNLSDLAAMGAAPTAFTCAIALPEWIGDEVLQGIAAGMAALARTHGAVLCGGNFTKAKELSITITAMGELRRESMRRSWARPGDLVLLIGDVGEAAAELRWLMNGKALPEGRSALHWPVPRVSEGLVAAECASCAIDVSDGLAQDLGHVARASRVKIAIDAREVPRTERFVALTEGLERKEKAELLLAGGEDYALVVMAPAEKIERIRSELRMSTAVVGRVESGEGVVVENVTAGVVLEGHDHFRA